MSRDSDLLPARSLVVVGGPLGRHASPRAASWAVTVVPLLFAAVGTMAAGVLERSHCIQKGWAGSDQFWHACFSDLPALYQLGGLHQGLAAFVSGGGARTDHPVLTGSAMALLGGLVPDGSFLDQTRWYFGLWAVLATVLVLAMVWLTAASRPRHVADAAALALSPVLLLSGLVSADVLGVALAAAGIWAWAGRRPALAGVFLGLAVTARTYPVLLLVALVLLALRTGRWAAVGRAAGAAAATVAVVLLPFLVANPGAILRPYAAWWDSEAGLGSPWMIPQLLGSPLPSGAVTLLAVVGMVVALLLGVLFALSTWRRPSVAEVGLVMVAIVLVTGKSFPVQSSLWLVPLVALCGVRWRDHLVWAGAEAAHFIAVWLYVGGLSKPDRGLPPGWYLAFLVVRVLAVGYLTWRVWHTAALRDEAPELPTHPESSEDLPGPGPSDLPKTPEQPGPAPDPDSDAVVDELAGDFTDAPDRLLVRLG
jgi:hypothetical protein